MKKQSKPVDEMSIPELMSELGRMASDPVVIRLQSILDELRRHGITLGMSIRPPTIL